MGHRRPGLPLSCLITKARGTSEGARLSMPVESGVCVPSRSLSRTERRLAGISQRCQGQPPFLRAEFFANFSEVRMGTFSGAAVAGIPPPFPFCGSNRNFAPGRGSGTRPYAALAAIQMTYRPPRPLWARAVISSTAKPARPRRCLNSLFGAADQTASRPPGRSALRAALRPRLS